MINTVLCGLTGSRCFVFLDDDVIYAKYLNEHDAKLQEVFGKFLKFNLKIQLDKRKLLRTEVITENGAQTDPRKVTPMENYPETNQCKTTKTLLIWVSPVTTESSFPISRMAAPLHA
jgi:hypothetical protein